MRVKSNKVAAIGSPAVLALIAWSSVGVTCALAQRYIEITPDETVLVERYVRGIPEPPPIIEQDITLRPGSVIPEAVPLRPFEKVAALSRYVYFISVDHKIVVADPQTRVVVRILDQPRQ